MKSEKKIPGALIMQAAIVLLSFVSGSLSAQPGWYKVTSPTSSDLHAVCFKDALNGCVIGEDLIYKTSNGGVTWEPIKNLPFGENDYFTFESLCYTNASTGWIAGDLFVNPPGQHHKIILKTTNAGTSWAYSFNAESESGLMSVCYKNPYVGFSVGGYTILRSGDLGNTWEQCNYQGNESDDFNFKSVCFINSLTGYVAGEVYTDPPGILSQVVFKTTNAGNNWIETWRSPEVGLNSVNFCNSNTGWSVGGGVIKATINGGATWITQAAFGGHNNHYSLEHVYFSDQLTGWVSGGVHNTITSEYLNLLIKTTDGGQTWTQQFFSSGKSEDYILNSVYFIDNLRGWAVGDGGVIMKTTDGGATYIDPAETTVPGTFTLYQNYPNPFNPSTKIKFSVPSTEGWMSRGQGTDGVGLVTLKVYDILGKEVATLVNETLKPGTYEVTFDAAELPSGVYFYNLSAGDFTGSKRMILVK